MLSSVFLVNNQGVILIEKQYKEKVSRTEIEQALLAIQTKGSQVPAIIENGDFTILLHKQNEIWVVGVCEGDDFAQFAISLLQHIGSLIEDLLAKGATEISVKDEYPQVYQILDLAVDYGFPFLDEGNSISTVINRPPPDPKVRGSNKIQFDLDTPWRQMGVKRLTNEILLDFVETIDLVVSSNGRVDFSHIRGEIQVSSRLSGKPMAKLVMMPSTHFEDVCFHRCAMVDTPDAKVIPFIPPEGKFVLLKYRLTSAQINAPIWLVPKFTWSKGSVTFEIALRPDQNLSKGIENIVIEFEFPRGVNTPSLAAPEGRASFDSKTNVVTWNIPFFSKKETITFKGSASTEQGFELCGRHPVVTAQFSVTGAIPSGFKVDHLDLEAERLYKGIKYISKAGSYEFRTGF
ncbi:Adaptor complexes medium subunit family protein [Trichomonas vaginalis G3]|uniref:Adaptor complexes medium subunit family protein n=1 Tax=Trichomonas vaginalis (strain ATCC PRA-98 / G3) TaxID=412133 RepID=A2G8G2_TRIV3|nr:anterograde synaptic vesicle transport [Trichomonas vaginalis G3]EAX86554.1 Adaptor complexes medium subunit family protein [Trichomonas vaginalis G3]KAI5529853.1 anterograde synaptic vesicle transport [Trichomonas vaginalis G3]|eukprot:XP_001299484.1 Adaptor complexes medium subunit family protein [Trichomonas vaginalis G3]